MFFPEWVTSRRCSAPTPSGTPRRRLHRQGGPATVLDATGTPTRCRGLMRRRFRNFQGPDRTFLSRRPQPDETGRSGNARRVSAREQRLSAHRQPLRMGGGDRRIRRRPRISANSASSTSSSLPAATTGWCVSTRTCACFARSSGGNGKLLFVVPNRGVPTIAPWLKNGFLLDRG